MSEQLPTAVTLWQELRKYLKVETEISKPKMVINCIPQTNHQYTKSEPHKTQIEVVHIKVTFNNTAPCDLNWPRVVFTGVGLGITRLSEGVLEKPRWADYPALIIQKPYSGGVNGHPLFGATSYNGFPELTEDENNHGIALFPGDSATIELTIPTVDIPNYELYIEGSVSRRHLLHYQEKLEILQTQPNS